ncbi:flagellar basal body rod protein FlgB [Manganibacter manganicus]|jgi:flagellar basal-body rod protein FlgB|uniref:Flagellar basal body rod protein FlgB n=1 Tax=Manganibacter manganicus TaxID=1873176 RepID=A0A1V8RV10_9HYPH|nr:flagellar basal body rod protein FlgB [Pseudaminobacter manganicus]OQM77031.1 flagellar basal body rod protein FlgB [Pseudaminobacter manganicus]
MDPVNLFDLATRQAQWLAVRQTTVASNIANVNTPGYTARDVESFEKILDRTAVTLRATQQDHLSGEGVTRGIAVKPQEPDGAVLPSGNTVVMENELLKAGEVRRAFELNTAIVKAFHSMMLAATKA